MTIHLPAESAMALAMVMSDPRYNLMLKRNAAEQAIEDLIQFLDDSDGDSDFEPSLGFGGAGDDREGGDVQDEPHDEIDEDGRDVSWPANGPQVLSGAWCTEDDEDSDPSEESDHGGGNVTDEPHDQLDEGNEEMPLGWSLDMDQRKASAQSSYWAGYDGWDAA